MWTVFAFMLSAMRTEKTIFSVGTTGSKSDEPREGQAEINGHQVGGSGWSDWIAPVLPEASLIGCQVKLEDRSPGGGILGTRVLHLDNAHLKSEDKSLVQESTDLAFTGAVTIREFNNTVRLEGFATYQE